MKMRYRRDPEVFFRSSRPATNWHKIGLVVAIVGLLFFGSILVQGLSSPVLFLAQPLFKITGQLEGNLQNVGIFMRGQKTLISDRTAWREQVTKLQEQNLILTERIKSYESLISSVATSTLAKLKPVRILSRPGRSPYDTLIVNRGEADGLKPQDLVFSSGGVVLGEVSHVYSNSAQVVLFSTPGRNLTVEVGEQHVQATAEGQGSGNFKIVLPRGVDIKVGDAVVAPSVSEDVLGVVGSIEAKPENPFQTIYFKSPVNLYELVWVFIKN